MPRVVLVTGASSGLGRSCAEQLCAHGDRVYGTSRSARFPSEADAVVAKAGPPVPQMIPMDVRDDASVSRAVEHVVAREGRLDVLVNNAGVGLAAAIEDTRVEEAQALFDTNLFGAHRVCRAVLPILRSQGSGWIVNLGSIGGRIAIPFQGFYSASKAALASMNDALRLELAPFGIRVVLIEPGDFHTGFTEARVFGEGGRSSPYTERCRHAVAVMERDERAGADPLEVARLLERVLASRTPRARYLVGRLDQRLGARIRPLLPDRLFDRLLRGIYDA